ncbi:serine/threonine protein phosphatase [Streptomyces albidoflavus]|uniref:PP2C family protein-serine/threonine phosphatase n=1 Tax=Streptomyces albidoflavus TaxID=1886 RepID=UPI00101F544C|nr:PP2C family protein-serine/threonine phosphatase [Streptomyces albidoflavus]RZD68152.1 serine/threonine protein phosphatase [Streptomyces albidoflavus]
MDVTKSSTIGAPRARTGRTAAPGAWDEAPCPVLVADAAGAVVTANAHATALFPAAVPGAPLSDAVPEWLGAAHRAAVAGQEPGDAVSGAVGERVYRAVARPAADGGSRGAGAAELVWWLSDDTGRAEAEAALAVERARTAFLSEASNALLATLNTERCMEVTAQLAARHLADGVVVVLPGAGRRTPLAWAVDGGGSTRALLALDPAEVPGLAEALQGFPPVPSRWIDPEALPTWAVPEEFDGPVGAVAVIPLPGHGVPAGALILLRREGKRGFTEPEEVFARLFAARAGAALSAARMYAEQAAVTQTLMRELLPPRLEQIRGVEFAGGYRASERGERVGGDFYDVHPTAGEAGASLVVLGDVCGKGLDAAVLTGKIRNTLQALLPMADDHPRVLRMLNDSLLSSHHTRFATLVLASAVREGDAVRLDLTSAGHPPPLLVRADGTVEAADTRGSLVGALPEVEATTARVTLRAGETCLLYTDGVTEARGGPFGDRMFGEERLREALAECAGMPAEAVVERVQMLAAQWVGAGEHDDMAMVAVTVPRKSPGGVVSAAGRGRGSA